jgi:tetraacyldisaccharide 4'-kinase
MKKNIVRWFQDAWYKEMYFSNIFVPFSMIFDDFRRIKLFLYKIGVYKKSKLSVPVINVGSITVGGTGKTHLVLWLARFLREQGYKPGIVSSGYGGNSEIWPQWVDDQSMAEQVGDEAVLMARRVDCPIVVGSKVIKACQMLLDKSNSNVILVNDGLQQYSLINDIEIAVIDGERRFGNGYMLPCGPLREPVERLQKVDLVIVNGIETEENEFSMTIKGDSVINCVTNEEKLLNDFSKQPIHAIASIGNPKHFFDLLERKSISLDSHAFSDHHNFTGNNISFKDDKPVLMTEKDAVKCLDFCSEKCWFVPITVKPQQVFVDKLITLLK